MDSAMGNAYEYLKNLKCEDVGSGVIMSKSSQSLGDNDDTKLVVETTGSFPDVLLRRPGGFVASMTIENTKTKTDIGDIVEGDLRHNGWPNGKVAEIIRRDMEICKAKLGPSF